MAQIMIVLELPPSAFYNILVKKGDNILLSQDFHQDHSIVYWNIILYFKVLNLPCFILDLDYSTQHVRSHCQSIKKFLPAEKKSQFFNGLKTRISSSGLKNLPPKLDSNALSKLNQANMSQVGKDSSDPSLFDSQILKSNQRVTEQPNSTHQDSSRITSGAIQQGVPTKLLAGLAMAAEPKSASLMSPESVRRILPALMSL